MVSTNTEIRYRVVTEGGAVENKCVDTAIANQYITCGSRGIGKRVIATGPDHREPTRGRASLN